MIKKLISILTTIFISALISASVLAAEKPVSAVTPLNTQLEKLRDDLSSYFIAVSGKVKSVSADSREVVIDKGSSAGIKTGMHINVFNEGATFVHPVTKEPLGKMELPVGRIAIISVDKDSARGQIISGNPVEFKGARIKISARKIRAYFFQGTVDWNLGDAYYRTLLDSGRFELVDTGNQTAATAEIIADAKKNGAEVAIVLHSEDRGQYIALGQSLYWISDGKKFAETQTSIHLAAVKQLKYNIGSFGPTDSEAMLTYRLPFSARRIMTGDFSGTGQIDLVMATDNRLGVYKMDVDLKLLYEIDIPVKGDILWVDTLDIDKDGRDEILVTVATGIKSNFEAYASDEWMKVNNVEQRGTVTSFIFRLEKDKFRPIWRGENIFIRTAQKTIMAQEFDPREGFDGRLYAINYVSGKFVKGDLIKMPSQVNIYDFQFVYAPDGRRGVFAWDDKGFVNFYNDKGLKTWTSREDFGGFADTFKKESKAVTIDQGNWYMKDKFVSANSEVLVPKRNSMFGFINIRSLGYASSELRSLWWNGITVEERKYMDAVTGNILDYAVVGDRLIVLVKPYLISMGANLFKGENPFVTMIYVYSTKGR